MSYDQFTGTLAARAGICLYADNDGHGGVWFARAITSIRHGHPGGLLFSDYGEIAEAALIVFYHLPDFLLRLEPEL